MNKDRKLILAGTAAAVALLAVGGLWMSRDAGAGDFAQCQKSVVSGGMEAFGTEFTLTNGAGERVTDKQVFDRPSLLYFGYTFCPDVCPLDSARNAEASALLVENGIEVQPVFVTVDPARDTPEVVKTFTEQFSTPMVGLTGSDEEIQAVSKGWRNYFKLHNEEDKEYYLVDHMTNTYLVLPGHGTVEFFGRDASPDEVAERTACFVEAAS
ncbi:SCO family protein [Paracoccus zhejiangensis]|uniref:SCO family protein n=1 Tax=Paracoccus zhejiangensis TaxID=1077935 RepID=A0A2H5F0R7_9RHOB|nr:SCO family protein [Paracoccus zhejiangensis]AUH65127.1 SCO family protein [Paracoccus zhejiangensis]